MPDCAPELSMPFADCRECPGAKVGIGRPRLRAAGSALDFSEGDAGARQTVLRAECPLTFR